LWDGNVQTIMMSRFQSFGVPSELSMSIGLDMKVSCNGDTLTFHYKPSSCWGIYIVGNLFIGNYQKYIHFHEICQWDPHVDMATDWGTVESQNGFQPPASTQDAIEETGPVSM